MKNKSITAFLAFVFFAAPLQAYDMPFFFAPARFTALGGASSCIKAPEYAAACNPAFLASREKMRLGLNGSLFSYDFSPNEGEKENFTNHSASVSAFLDGWGFLADYTLSGDTINYIEGYDRLVHSGYNLHLGFGHMLSDNFSAGASVRILAGFKHLGGASLNIGLSYEPSERIGFCAALQNLAASGDFIALSTTGAILESEQPLFVNLGISARPFDGLLMLFEAKNVTASSVGRRDLYSGGNLRYPGSYHTGMELVIGGFALRGGAFVFEQEGERRAGITAGAGFVSGIISADIAYKNDFRRVYGISNPAGISAGISGVF